ncbi:hypothetical protein MATL_G00009060 [Megalops atlanticus]|uniref:Partner and localiser of BRCA2 WD40 domain-containing protein n=1 Tax=Megalops atlanticus TaxID=7932 RepID=A0A9D3QGX2_MEGAT|nr:hypothetical protein MATL_G00009060 [Megalops atlanticus]
MEESLESELHCDDKEKLRQRLALLQREYNRTVQKLQRAERFEAVRKHVRSRIAEENLVHQEPSDKDGPSKLGEAEERRRCPVSRSDPVEHGRNTAVRFSQALGALSPCASPRTTGGSSESSRLSDASLACSPLPAQGRGRRSAHRLRSRRSRLRWESRERADSGVSDTENSEDGQDLARQRDRRRGGSFAGLCRAEESRPEAVTKPSSLCSGENGPGGPAIGETDMEAALMQSIVPENLFISADCGVRGSDNRVKGDIASPVNPQLPLLETQTVAISEPPVISKITLTPASTLSPSKMAENHAELMSEGSQTQPESLEEERRPGGTSPPASAQEPLAAGCLSSCTLIEGLLFPVEYYVRTTRRMSSAQSSVDLGAVIQSQLSQGRRGRGRRGRGGSRATRNNEGAVAASNSETRRSKDPDSAGHITPESESSQTLCSPPAVPGAKSPRAKPIRGRRRRGRGRGCGQGHRGAYTPAVASPASIDSTPLEPLGAEAVLTPDTDTHSGAAEKQHYPIFHTKRRLTESASPKISRSPFIKGSARSNRKECLRASKRSSAEGVNCESLLLPSSPAPRRPHVLSLGGNGLSLHSVLSQLDIKDFDLPDDEFGRLKLDKLRTLASGDLEPFLPHQSRYHTRRRASGASAGNSRYKKSPLPSMGGLSGFSMPASAARPQHLNSSEEPAEMELQTPGVTDLGSVRSTPEPLNYSLKVVEVAQQGEGRNCGGLLQEGAKRLESMSKTSPLDAECTGHVKTASTGTGEGPKKGQEAKSVGEGTVAAVGAPSPHVLNLSPTPTVHTQKSDTLCLPSLGSSTFPSLGVTPAFPVCPSSPTPVCPATTPSKSQGPLTQPILQPATYWTHTQGPAVSSQPSSDTEPPSLSQTPGTDVQDPSQNARCAETAQAEPHNKEESANGDQRALNVAFPESANLSLTDSLSSSLFYSRGPSAQCCNPVLSPSVECRSNHCSPCPQRAECDDSQEAMPGHAVPPCIDSLLPSMGGEGKNSNRAHVPSSAKDPVSTLPPLGLRDEQDAVMSGRQSPTDTGKSALTPHVVEDDPAFTLSGLNTDPHKPTQDSLKTQVHSATEHPVPLPTSIPATPLPLSLRSEHGEKDLDSYFTDSAWSREAGTLPQPGQAFSGPDPVEEKLEASPSSSPATSLRLTHTLEAPAGRCLVDVCSVYGAAGWCVATAGEWAVCLWGQSSPDRWSLLHTWTFDEHPVIALFSVPDAPSLLCVSLGQLEIRQARVLSCGGAEGPLSQSVLYTGEMQAVLGVSDRRVACCATSVSTQTVHVFTLTEDGRLDDSLTLVSPGRIVRALAVVEGQRDALIGSTDSHLVLWNMRTGHLLQRFSLGETFSGTVCLRGYSESGILFVLLQHRFLCKPDEEEGGPFSLIATNPVTARSVLVHHLTPPSVCEGRFMDGDVRGSSVVAVFQSGALVVWDLRDGDCVPRVAHGPDEGCHLARWGAPSTLLAGHLNGDVSLYQYTPLRVL